MKYYVSKAAVCPFYKQEEKTKLRCCGYEKGVHMHLVFGTQAKKAVHERRFCYHIKGYLLCPYYKIAAKQFEEDGK